MVNKNNNKKPIIAVAPMMDWTDRHDRYFLRLIAPHILLYTEMITSQALHHGDVDYLLNFNPAEHPIALQVGGSDPTLLAKATKLGEAYGYDEINLNVGCPSNRVKAGRFGACLMLEPHLVAECIHAMARETHLPVTVKCRIGVDNNDSYDALYNFVSIVSSAGCKTFIIHARKALLSGLSPKENREIPPLRYDVVKRLKQDFPTLTIILNGGIKTIADMNENLKAVDGIMIGREAYTNPFFLAEIEGYYFDAVPKLDRYEVIKKFIPYVSLQLQNGVKLSSITRHILGLFHGQWGASQWRRHLSTEGHKPGAGIEVIEQAIALTNR